MKPRGARQWGDNHKVGRARERRGKDAVLKPHSHPDDRPACPRCGATGAHINKAGRKKAGPRAGVQMWTCFACQKRFLDPAEVKAREALTTCPQCRSDRIEQEADGTWVCWVCDWFR